MKLLKWIFLKNVIIFVDIIVFQFFLLLMCHSNFHLTSILNSAWFIYLPRLQWIYCKIYCWQFFRNICASIILLCFNVFILSFYHTLNISLFYWVNHSSIHSAIKMNLVEWILPINLLVYLIIPVISIHDGSSSSFGLY